jgi:hypothetical protein
LIYNTNTKTGKNTNENLIMDPVGNESRSPATINKVHDSNSAQNTVSLEDSEEPIKAKPSTVMEKHDVHHESLAEQPYSTSLPNFLNLYDPVREFFLPRLNWRDLLALEQTSKGESHDQAVNDEKG